MRILLGEKTKQINHFLSFRKVLHHKKSGQLSALDLFKFKRNYILRLVPFLSNSDKTLPGSLKRLLIIIAAII